MTSFEYPWKEQYQETLVERDLQKLAQKIEAVENTIFLRFQELGDGDHGREGIALKEALHALRVLQTEKLHYPKLPNE